MSPLDNFHTLRPAVTPDVADGASGNRYSFGLAPTIVSLPAGFEYRVVAWSSLFGVTDTTFGWGSVMQTFYNTTRISPTRDPVTTHLSYWSDNGAVLFQVSGRGVRCVEWGVSL